MLILCFLLILINGAAFAFFKPTTSLRQGYPLSPLLFILVVGSLSRAVMKAKRIGGIQGIEIGTVFRTRLLFVDDILLFLNGYEREARKLQEILNLYSVATGMEVSAQKSTYDFSGLSEKLWHRLGTLFPFRSFQLYEGLKYSNFIHKPNGYVKRNWGWLLERIECRIFHWCDRWLSRVGRLTLVKSILETIPMYWQYWHLFLKGCWKDSRRYTNFLWGGSSENKGMHLVKWLEIAKPRALGS